MAVQEDDATELQFPKGMLQNDLTFEDKCSNAMCSFCNESLHYPYIQCAECQLLINDRREKLYLCLRCFAKGKEPNFHKNDHCYAFIKETFLFSEDWTSNEELCLLDSIFKCGLGNWENISKLLHKTPEECRKHFIQYYGNSDTSSKVQTLPIKSAPYTCGSDDPPRPFIDSDAYSHMAGYNGARGDFTIEYLNKSESLIQDLDDSIFEDSADDSLLQELQFKLIDIYRRQQGERHFRKKLVKDHGLINVWKSQYFLHCYERSLPDFNDILPKMHQLVGFEELLYILEGLLHQEELGQKIKSLKEYRTLGLRKKSQASFYNSMKNRRLSFKKMGQQLISQGSAKLSIGGVPNSTLYSMMRVSMKRRSIPLDISGEKDFEKLSDAEKEMASNLRIIPMNYLKFKNCLINECLKNNGLRLHHARQLMKIDVNKVRVIYNYLVAEGRIHSPL